jgi:hypothetical protein
MWCFHIGGSYLIVLNETYDCVAAILAFVGRQQKKAFALEFGQHDLGWKDLNLLPGSAISSPVQSF